MASPSLFSARRTLWVIALGIGLAACESTIVGPMEPGPPAGTVGFAADIQPLFTSGCGGGSCHVGQSTSGVNLSDHAAVRASVGSQYGDTVVMPGDAAGSALVDKIEASPRFGSRMPLGRATLTAQQIAQVRAWIDAGALDT